MDIKVTRGGQRERDSKKHIKGMQIGCSWKLSDRQLAKAR